MKRLLCFWGLFILNTMICVWGARLMLGHPLTLFQALYLTGFAGIIAHLFTRHVR